MTKDELRAALEARGLPVREGWLAFEERWGGTADYGVARWLDARRNREAVIDARGRLAILICVRNLDWCIYLDEDGRVHHEVTSCDEPVAIATSFDVYLAREAFWREASAALGPDSWDPWIELVADDPALVAALDLARDDAASDAICERYRDDRFAACVVHRSAVVDQAKTRLYGRDLDALVARVIELGARFPHVPVCVFGWPNARTADVRAALAAALPQVRERNDYIGPLEPSDFVR